MCIYTVKKQKLTKIIKYYLRVVRDSTERPKVRRLRRKEYRNN